MEEVANEFAKKWTAQMGRILVDQFSAFAPKSRPDAGNNTAAASEFRA